MEKISKLDENFNKEDALKWSKEFLGLKPEQSFQDIEVDENDD